MLLAIITVAVQFVAVTLLTILVDRFLSTRAAVVTLCLCLAVLGYVHRDYIKGIFTKSTPSPRVSPPQPSRAPTTSRSNPFSSFSAERLNDTAIASLNALKTCQATLSRSDPAFQDDIGAIEQAYKQRISGANDADKVKAKNDLERGKKREKQMEENAFENVRKRCASQAEDAYNAYHEIADWLRPYQTEGIYPDKISAASFAKLREGTYDLQDLNTAISSLQLLQHTFETAERLRGLRN